MRILLDTNILIHREARTVIRSDIGLLFRWLDRLKHRKLIDPRSIKEIERHADSAVVRTFKIKLGSYEELKTIAPDVPGLAAIRANDRTENDRIDSSLVNELAAGRVDCLITEDRAIHDKAALLGLAGGVFTIDGFLEKVTAENPGLVDYKTVSIRKELFGNINVSETFFDSFRQDYLGFDGWFASKANEEAYVCRTDGKITAFLYLKIEDKNEPYPDIEPTFSAKKRLKIGTLKVALNGVKLGERFLKIVFDNAIRLRVAEIYVTVFERDGDQQRLVNLLEDFGFRRFGAKKNSYGNEAVFTRDMSPRFESANPLLTYPFFPKSGRSFIVSIYEQYHTSLFPDSILRTESPASFVEHEPHRNAIRKVYVSRAYRRDLRSGDILVFYRTGGYYKGVASTIGIVESVVTGIKTAEEFISVCRKRSVFTDAELLDHWNYSRGNRPFIVNFLYSYSLPKRPNMARLIQMGIFKDVNSAPRGFEELGQGQLEGILKESEYDDRIVVD
jgi:hypothetical protein